MQLKRNSGNYSVTGTDQMEVSNRLGQHLNHSLNDFSGVSLNPEWKAETRDFFEDSSYRWQEIHWKEGCEVQTI